ncbi:MerR family transcriptional regulator [Streptomyces sp. NPDC057428]|uniref:MerR family transcriptional regulator n=1 Tax=Streptomyces sp. NPDC057428 TaxID=3346129 RepID=UPI0036BFD1BF
MFSSWDGLCGIGELAGRAGVSVKTVRFYSDRGLLPEASRSPGGHRRYGPDALERLRMIRSLRTLDLPVSTVRRVLDEDDAGRTGGALEDAVAGQLAELGSQLATLRWREAALRAVQESPPSERPGRLLLVGAVTAPPDTGPLARFWRAWLPPRMPKRSVSAFLDAAVPQPPEEVRPAAPAHLHGRQVVRLRKARVQHGRLAGARRSVRVGLSGRVAVAGGGHHGVQPGEGERGRHWKGSWTPTRERATSPTPRVSAARSPGGSRRTRASTGTGS